MDKDDFIPGWNFTCKHPITCFFYKQSKFRNQAGACLWKNLVQAQSMLELCLFIKTLLGVCLRKRLDQARNMLIEKKTSLITHFFTRKKCEFCLENSYTKYVVVVTDYNIIGHLASSELHLFCCIFDEFLKENALQYLTEKIIVWKNSCYPEKCLT